MKKTILKRILLSPQVVERECQTKGRQYLCRKGKEFWVSTLNLMPMQELLTDPGFATTPSGVVYVQKSGGTLINALHLDELNLLVTQ